MSLGPALRPVTQQRFQPLPSQSVRLGNPHERHSLHTVRKTHLRHIEHGIARPDKLRTEHLQHLLRFPRRPVAADNPFFLYPLLLGPSRNSADTAPSSKLTVTDTRTERRARAPSKRALNRRS